VAAGVDFHIDDPTDAAAQNVKYAQGFVLTGAGQVIATQQCNFAVAAR